MAQKPLSPCPECGGKAKLMRGMPNLGYKGAPIKGNAKERYAKVQCKECGFTTETLKPRTGEHNKELYERAVSCWERLCEEKKQRNLGGE